MKPHIPSDLQIIAMTVYGWTAAFFLMDLWPKSDNTTVVMLRVWPNMFLAAVIWEVSARVVISESKRGE